MAFDTTEPAVAPAAIDRPSPFRDGWIVLAVATVVVLLAAETPSAPAPTPSLGTAAA